MKQAFLPVDIIILGDEGHSMYHIESNMKYVGSVLDFLDENLNNK